MDNTIIATTGHTAAGKSTMAQHLIMGQTLEMDYISEGQIKRHLRPEYSTRDSLDENLRDMAYKIAINDAIDAINRGRPLQLIDASFHRLFRRKWLYYNIQKNNQNIRMVWLFLYCPNLTKVEQRINNRKLMVKAADNQADSVDIFKHIISSSELPSLNEIPEKIESAIIYINTDTNIIEKIEKQNGSTYFDEFIELICKCIETKLDYMKDA